MCCRSEHQITAKFLLSNQNNESKIEQPKLNQNFPIILTHYHLVHITEDISLQCLFSSSFKLGY